MRLPTWSPPSRAPLWLLLLGTLGLGSPGLAAEGDRSWTSVQTLENFAFHADFPLERYHDTLTQLASLRSQLQQELQIHISAELVDVYLFAQQETYESYLRRYFPEIPQRKALFVKANSPGNVFAYVTPELTVDLRHECTHAMLHAALPVVPLWLDEGLAEYFEIPPDEQRTSHTYLASFRRGLHWKSAPSLLQLEKRENLHDMGKKEYRDAWAWVHFLLHGPPAAKQALLEYLADLQAHRPPGQFTERLAQHVPDAERQMRTHFLQWKP